MAWVEMEMAMAMAMEMEMKMKRKIERINLHRHWGVRDNRGTYRHSRRLFLIKSSHSFL